MRQRPWYATNARNLLAMREQGLAPAGPVVVSMVGGEFAEVAETTLYLNADLPLERADWRMLVNLEVWLWADGTVPLSRVLQALDGIARARPKRLCLRFDHQFAYTAWDGSAQRIDTHDLEIGCGYHWPAVPAIDDALHEFDWTPITLNGTPLERRLKAAAVGQHRSGTVL